ncbi:unnamed protein product [Dibothriocephalus latus]|uniref:Uncharacterized protein n=1 Tax=Dibothriocephalus latus TaxID=60516 RepID=A0A3P7LIN3_DIBLA|nr:unnamed protein product [Dibothriocephalus latus]
MLSSFIANLSRLHQNAPFPPVLSTRQPPILSQMSPTFLHLKSAPTEGDRVGYNCDSDQLTSLETAGELEEHELQSTIAGGALSSLINMTFSKMLTLAEAKTLKGK